METVGSGDDLGDVVGHRHESGGLGRGGFVVEREAQFVAPGAQLLGLRAELGEPVGESGHRVYSDLTDLAVPVLSAARSVLKHPEDRLIGPSLAFTVERCLRQMGTHAGGMSVVDHPDGSVVLLAGGSPANFLDGAVVGPVLSLVQAEMIAAVGRLASGQANRGLGELPMKDKRTLAAMWLEKFAQAEE